MRARMKTALAAAALLGIAACSSGGGVRKPAPVRAYGPEAGTVSQASRPAPAPIGGSYIWNNRLADAQAQARASGKLILVASTKPGCTLCEKFKNRIVPSVAAQAGAMSVGYVYDITRPEVRQIDQILRANLKGASLMPLIGFLTPDLRWVHGFWGARTVAEFQGDIATASRLHPVRSAQIPGPTATVGVPRTAMTAVMNEYGEPEWSVPGDVWPVEGDPEPIDAITGTPAPTDPFGAAGGPAPVLADAQSPSPPIPTQLPTLTPAPIPAPPAPPLTVPAGADTPRSAAVPPRPPPPSAPTEPRWSEPLAGARPVAAAPRAAPKSDDVWGREALALALSQIQGERYDAARSTLDAVRARLPDTTIAREASKGDIALYNSKRIRTATSEAERERFLSRARRDLGKSMWSPLFSS